MRSAKSVGQKGNRTSRAKLVRLVWAGAALAVVAIGTMIWADQVCRSAAVGRIFRSVDQIPQNDVGLVLGTGKTTARGNPNLHFKQRIEAAATLYHPAKSGTCS